jgi:Fe2+ or Zn2+ uptake regulation protein
VSRGPGRTQRAILEALRENVDGLTAAELAEQTWGSGAHWSPSHAQRETIRRALGNLARRGLVNTFYIKHEATPAEVRLHLASSITVIGFDLAEQLRRQAKA